MKQSVQIKTATKFKIVKGKKTKSTSACFSTSGDTRKHSFRHILQIKRGPNPVIKCWDLKVLFYSNHENWERNIARIPEVYPTTINKGNNPSLGRPWNTKGLPAYSHHDRFPPWWVFVRDDNGGNLSGDKIPPLMMIIINHLTQFNSSHWWWLLIIWLSSTRLKYTMLCYKKELL